MFRALLPTDSRLKLLRQQLEEHSSRIQRRAPRCSRGVRGHSGSTRSLSARLHCGVSQRTRAPRCGRCCSGKILTVPANDSWQAQVCAWAMGHPFCSSGNSVRTQHEGFVDTIPFPVMRKSALLEVGGYDETLLRNQDNDMNQKLRARGYKLFLTEQVHCLYYARSSLAELWRWGYQSGRWNAISLRRNPISLRPRHFVPLIFVLSILFLASANLRRPCQQLVERNSHCFVTGMSRSWRAPHLRNHRWRPSDRTQEEPAGNVPAVRDSRIPSGLWMGNSRRNVLHRGGNRANANIRHREIAQESTGD